MDGRDGLKNLIFINKGKLQFSEESEARGNRTSILMSPNVQTSTRTEMLISSLEMITAEIDITNDGKGSSGLTQTIHSVRPMAVVWDG